MKRAYAWFLRRGAVAIVAVAALMAIMRHLLPGIGDYREEIQAWVSQYMHQPVVVGAIEADWRGWTPVIALSDIELRDGGGRRTITRFASAAVAIDLWRSLRARRLVPAQLTVSGVRISLLRTGDGLLRIEGVDPNSPDLPGDRQNALADWLLQQQNLTVDSATITWRDEIALLAPVVFSDVRVQIRSDGERRQLNGSARLPAEVGRSFEFRLDAHGDLLTTRWSGELYVEGAGINPVTVLNYQHWLGLHLTGGEVDFRLWSRWSGARLAAIDGRIEGHDVAMGVRGSGAGAVTFARAAGDLKVQRGDDSRWTIGLRNIDVLTGSGRWPAAALEVTLVPAAGSASPSLVASASYLRLEDLAPLIASINAVPDAIRIPLAEIAPHGELRNLRVGYFPERPADQRFYVRTEFARIQTGRFRGVPGVKGLKGTLKADAAGGDLRLDSRDLALDPGGRLTAPLGIGRLEGAVAWQRSDAGWQARGDRVQLELPALTLQLSGAVDGRAGEPPQARIAGAILGGDLSRLAGTLPPGALSPKGQAWIAGALRAGRVTGGTLLLYGPLDRFPFDDGSGQFQVSADVQDGLLAFSPLWPTAEGIRANVRFDGRRMTVNAPHGRILGADLADVSAVIDGLGFKDRTLALRGTARAPAAEARRIMQASPLATKLGPQLAGIDVDGALALELDLTLPLYPGATRTTRGRVHLAGNRIVARDLRLEFDRVSGALEFVNGAWTAPNLAARYLGTPVTLDLEGGRSDGEFASRYRMHGSADRDFIRRQMEAAAPLLSRWFADRDLLDHLSGQSPWQAEVTSGFADEAGNRARNLTVRSTLAGIAIDMPAPVGKDADDERAIEIATRFGDADRHLRIRYGDDLDADFTLVRDPAGALHMNAAAVRFGGGEPRTAPPAPIWLEGAVASLSVTRWTRLLGHARPPAAAKDGPAPAAPGARHMAFDLDVGDLEAFGQAFGRVRARGTEAAPGWKLELEGERIAGNVDVGRARGAPVRVALARLQIGKPRRDPDDQTRVDPAGLPPIEAHCDSFIFESADLGTADLTSEPRADGLHLTRLHFVAPGFDIDASGDWLASGGGHTSHFRIDVKAGDIGALLKRFGYDVAAIESDSTELRIDAAWSGPPAEFKLANLDGVLDMKIEDGRLLDVDPKAGRLFGLLSFQTLPRRLLLDFNDLFAKGMSFDTLNGAFRLERGNAYTTDLAMDGPSARIEVTGRTGLAEQDYDQVVTVRPQLSSTLPVAGALFGPAGIGVGAVLYLGGKVFKGIPNQLDKVLTRQYTIKGHWQEPVIEQVKNGDVSIGAR
ncbi:MAG: YhdP family protein [Gammaproteobacteria bacterium]